MKKNKKGFTLIELSLVVAIMSVVAGLSVPIYQSFQVKNSLDVTTNIIVQELRRAQTLAQSASEDSNWGVNASSGNIILFKGGDFSSRDTSFDETFDVSTAVSFSGVTEIIFSKIYGEPQPNGTITLTAANNDSKSIVINSKGMIEY
jgi:prepilin-type N-terminal cleavage/methylation domain-containing protein